jgi:hypothetical protein
MFSQYICRLTRFWRLGSLRASDVLGAWTARHLVVRIGSDPSGALSACGALEIELRARRNGLSPEPLISRGPIGRSTTFLFRRAWSGGGGR